MGFTLRQLKDLHQQAQQIELSWRAEWLRIRSEREAIARETGNFPPALLREYRSLRGAWQGFFKALIFDAYSFDAIRKHTLELADHFPCVLGSGDLPVPTYYPDMAKILRDAELFSQKVKCILEEDRGTVLSFSQPSRERVVSSQGAGAQLIRLVR